MENKRKMVLDFIAKGEKLMQDQNCPKFLEGHVKKLREAWEDTNEKAQIRKKALADNLSSWEIFEDKKIECHKHLDTADAEFEQIKKIFDLSAGINYLTLINKALFNWGLTLYLLYTYCQVLLITT